MWCVNSSLHKYNNWEKVLHTGRNSEQFRTIKDNKDLFTGRHLEATFGHFCSVSMHWNISKNVFIEISKGEEGGRGRVLLPGEERRRTCRVSRANDGSLWVIRVFLFTDLKHPKVWGSFWDVSCRCPKSKHALVVSVMWKATSIKDGWKEEMIFFFTIISLLNTSKQS